jgi:hypothetical protein
MGKNVGLNTNLVPTDSYHVLWKPPRVGALSAEWIEWLDLVAVYRNPYSAPPAYFAGKKSVKYER